ncbi:MAG: hypothetical protein ACYC6N_23640 [Pirellulaceae bacterium]
MKRTTSNKKSPPSTSPTKSGPTSSDVPPATSGPLTNENRTTPGSEGLQGSPEPVVLTSFKVLAAHVVWMFLGPFALVLMLINIVQTGTGWFSAFDATFFVVVAVMLLARWVDQRSGQGLKATGEPSTWEDFRRYALLLPPLAAAAWIVANVIGNHMR